MYNTTYSLIPFKSHLREFIREKLPVSEVKPLPLNTFGKTYLTIALKRSGQHAIINWLCHHLKSAIHMNDCTFIHKDGKMMIVPSSGRFVYYYNQNKIDSGGMVEVESEKPFKAFFEKLKKIEKFDNIIYSFEETSLKSIYLKKFIKHYNPIVLLILRDPYNCLASSFQHHNGQNTLAEMKEKKQKLISYLKQALGIENYLNYPIFTIDYGKWVQHDYYINSLLHKLNIPFYQQAENSVTQIQSFGGGSSFDGTETDYTSLQKQVFERWKIYQNNSDYLDLLNDELLSELALDFFEITKPF